MAQHPLEPLTADEVRHTATIGQFSVRVMWRMPKTYRRTTSVFSSGVSGNPSIRRTAITAHRQRNRRFRATQQLVGGPAIEIGQVFDIVHATVSSRSNKDGPYRDMKKFIRRPNIRILDLPLGGTRDEEASMVPPRPGGLFRGAGETSNAAPRLGFSQGAG